MSLFIHLRAYSDYSLGMSNLKFHQIIMKCHDFNAPAICISDRNMFGTLEFAIGAAASGIQPIIGLSVDIDYESIKSLLSEKTDKNFNPNDNNGEALLIVKSKVGYSNLMKIATRIGVDRQGLDKPSVEWDFLVKHSDGLIILFGAVSDDKMLHRVISTYGVNGAKKLLELVNNDTELEPFIELTRYRDGRHKTSERNLMSLAYELNIPIVATNPISFLNQDTYEASEVLFCIINNRFLVEENRPKIDPEHNYKSQEEMMEIFSDLPEAIKNTELIAQKCHFFPHKQPISIPKFDPNIDANKILEQMAIEGLEERIEHLSIDRPKYFARLRLELDLIQKMNFSDYFLIVSDFIQWSKSQGIAVGPGRGSGVGSIIAWSLKITELDPIEFGLLFERFLNPERISMPDLDIDFCQFRRDEVLQYVKRKYGEDNIAHIITFGKLQPRAVLRDVGRVLQMPYGLIDRICKMIPQNQANPLTLQQAIDIDKQLQKLRDEDMAIERLLKIGLQLEGCNRNISTHAAGIVISELPIVEIMPLYRDPTSGILSGQFSMKYVEAAGLIKFDFLGLKTLTVISNTQELIKHSLGENINIYKIPLDDRDTYKMLTAGDVIGIFQLEGSAGIREAVKQMQPDKLGDITALTSLYRPGPMENIPKYIARKHGYEQVEVIHPDIKDVLNETYGIIVYQEQVIKIAQVLAGYSLGEADILRRAMGKKDKFEMSQQRSVFVTKCFANGLPESQAEEIFDLVNKFAGYGFNKAHGDAYALVTYQTAFLKCHYLIEFLVASMNLELHLQEKVGAFCDEAKANHIEVCKPTINDSMVFFAIEVLNDKFELLGVIESDITQMTVTSDAPVGSKNIKRIRYGLGGIKGTGVKALNDIVLERKKNGKFKDLDDFLKRTAKNGFNKRLFEQLVRSGAVEELYPNSHALIHNINKINQYVAAIAKEKNDHARQISLLNLIDIDDNNTSGLELIAVPYWSKTEKLQAEHSALGFYLTEHPVLLYEKILQKHNIMFSDVINKYTATESREISIAGVVKDCKIRSGKGEKAGKYGFLSVVDPYGVIDISVFDSNILNKQTKLLDVGQLVFCTATIRNDAQGQRILLRSIKPFMKAIEEFIQSFKVYVTTVEAAEFLHKKIQEEIEKEDRTLKISIVAICPDGSEVQFYSDKEINVTYSFIAEIMKVDGIQVLSKDKAP